MMVIVRRGYPHEKKRKNTQPHARYEPWTLKHREHNYIEAADQTRTFQPHVCVCVV